MMQRVRTGRMLQMVSIAALAVAVLGTGSLAAADEMTKPFTGKAVNGAR